MKNIDKINKEIIDKYAEYVYLIKDKLEYFDEDEIKKRIQNGYNQVIGSSIVHGNRRNKRNIDYNSHINIILDGFADAWVYYDGVYHGENLVYQEAKNNKSLLVKDWPEEAKSVIASALTMTLSDFELIKDKVFIADSLTPLDLDAEKMKGPEKTNIWYVFSGVTLDPETNTRRPSFRLTSGVMGKIIRNIAYNYLEIGEGSKGSFISMNESHFEHNDKFVYNGKETKIAEDVRVSMISALVEHVSDGDDTIVLKLHRNRRKNGLSRGGIIIEGEHTGAEIISLTKLDVKNILKALANAHQNRIEQYSYIVGNFDTLNSLDLKEKLDEANLNFFTNYFDFIYRTKYESNIKNILLGDTTMEDEKLKSFVRNLELPEHVAL